MISGKEDTANNFIRGHYTVGKDILYESMDALRRLAEECDSLQGFIMHHSLSGGTGSGVGALLLGSM